MGRKFSFDISITRFYLQQLVDDFVAQTVHCFNRSGSCITILNVQSQAIRNDFIKQLKLIDMHDSVLDFRQFNLEMLNGFDEIKTFKEIISSKSPVSFRKFSTNFPLPERDDSIH